MKPTRSVVYEIKKDDYELLVSILIDYGKAYKKRNYKSWAKEIVFKAVYGILREKRSGVVAGYRIWQRAPKKLMSRFRTLGISIIEMKQTIPADIVNKFEEIVNGANGLLCEMDLDKGKVRKKLTDIKGEEPVENIEAEIEEDYVSEFVRRTAEEFNIDTYSDVELLEILGQALYTAKSSPIDIDSMDISRLIKILGIERAGRKEKEEAISSGSIADLVLLYDEYVTSGKWLEQEFKWRKEELALLLRKLDREFEEIKTPELTPDMFKVMTGITVEEAKEIVGDPYDEKYAEEKYNINTVEHE